jgi:tetratricopeptide (TPR) repeat protein
MSRLVVSGVCIAALIGAAWWRYHAPAERSFAGSPSCRGCHPDFYQRWSTSHHGLAMQPYTPDFARRELEAGSGSVRNGDALYTFSGGSIEEQSTAGTHRYPIEHVMGGKNVYYFLTTLDRGRLQVLPMAYDVRTKSWIDTTASMTVHDLGPTAAPLHWQDRMLTFNTSCRACHVSQSQTNYDPKSDSYRTAWREPGINCEACHGPSIAHVRAMQSGRKGPANLGLISMKKLSAAQRNDLCATCHAKLIAITADFKPGDRFFDHYSVAGLENDDFFPDGRDYRENYTLTGWMMSPCARSGKLDCLHCHTSSGRYRFQDNQACLPCHEERVRNPEAHTHHKPDSVGSRCVSCHMPSTEYAHMRRTDHSMRPPTPAATLAYRSPNACNLCHTDREPGWADRQVRVWHKRDYQARVLGMARLIAAARKRDWSGLEAMLSYLRSADRDEIATASLVRLLWSCDDPRKIPVLAGLLRDPSPLVRAAAVDGLSQHLTDETLPGLLDAAHDDYRLVRVRAGAALAGLRDQRAEAATGEYLASLRARPDDYSQHLNLGVYSADRGRLQEALNEYETTLRLRPDFAPALVNVSVVYSRLGQDEKAESALRRAVQIDPHNSAAWLNLGLLLAEKNGLAEAETALRKALDEDSGNAAAAYNLAVILSRDRLEEAIAFARRAAQARPQEPKYAEALKFYEKRRGVGF